MFVRQIQTQFSEEEYFAIEQVSAEKHEYVGGQIYAMAGASPRHVDATSNLHGLLTNALAGSPCRVSVPDMRVWVASRRMYTFPDVTIACEPRDFRRVLQGWALTNPKVVGEVLSPTTREYDEGDKLDAYKRVASLTDILLVDTAALVITRWTRARKTWTSHVHKAGTVPLASLGVEVSVAAVFRDLSPLGDEE